MKIKKTPSPCAAEAGIKECARRSLNERASIGFVSSHQRPFQLGLGNLSSTKCVSSDLHRSTPKSGSAGIEQPRHDVAHAVVVAMALAFGLDLLRRLLVIEADLMALKIGSGASDGFAVGVVVVSIR